MFRLTNFRDASHSFFSLIATNFEKVKSELFLTFDPTFKIKPATNFNQYKFLAGRIRSLDRAVRKVFEGDVGLRVSALRQKNPGQTKPEQNPIFHILLAGSFT